MQDETLEFLEQASKQWRELLVSKPELQQALGKTALITTVGIKVPDLPGLFEAIGDWFETGDQLHAGPVNEVRTIATVRKHEPVYGDVRYIKILQRRPGRDDPLGPEHVDIKVESGLDVYETAELFTKAGLHAETQGNEAHEWVSVMHEDIEYKLVDHTVWDVCTAEMQQVSN